MKTRFAQCVRLKNLDMQVYREGKGFSPSQFGLVTVQKSRSCPGYYASIGEEEIPELHYGMTPSMAYLALTEQLERDADMSEMAKVLDFPQELTYVPAQQAA